MIKQERNEAASEEEATDAAIEANVNPKAVEDREHKETATI